MNRPVNRPSDLIAWSDLTAHGTIRRRPALILIKRLGYWVSTQDLLDIAYTHAEDGGPLAAKQSLKAHMHQLRRQLPPGYALDGICWWGRRLRKVEA